MELASAISGAATAFKLLQAALAARDDGKIKAALSEMGGKLYDATTSALESQQLLIAERERSSALQNELQELKLAAQERDRYTLTEVRPGAYAYAAKPEEGKGVQPPYLCQPCYDRGVKSVLRADRDFTYSPLLWACGENAKHSFEQKDQGT